jgi:HD superfamily phosphohydrolase
MSIAEASKRIPEKVFRDPVHDYIHIQQQVIMDLINTKEMQRLRRIKQMGTASYTFHGAEHSRFSHSLGVYEIARKICDKFVRNYAIEDGGVWDDSERLVVLCAALLHDIGHGPFSHTFESIFNTNHEEITQQIILSENTEVNHVLRSVSEDFPNKVASVINKTYPNPQVVQLISSQIDADRMDYLLRDSYFSGTNYGNFDLSRILRVMHPYKDGIRFDYNGMHAVEDYITSRYQMYMQVYFHPVSRGMEMLLNHLLKRAQELFLTEDPYLDHETYAPFLEPFFMQNWTLDDYLRLDDGVLQTYFQHWIHFANDPILKDLAIRFIDRKPFKSVTYSEEENQEDLKVLIDLVGKLGYDIRYYVALNSRFDLPYDFYRPSAEKPRTQIELVEKNGNMVELSVASSLIAAFTGQQRGDERIFLPNELFYGKNRNHITLFEPILKQIHAMTKSGKLTPLDEHLDID